MRTSAEPAACFDLHPRGWVRSAAGGASVTGAPSRRTQTPGTVRFLDLVIEGEETELDRNIVEELSDPLVHMIRNSIDHGLESPATRESRGKPALGTIRLSASHQRGGIVIEIQDDGKGLGENMRTGVGLATKPETKTAKPALYKVLMLKLKPSSSARTTAAASGLS